MHTTVKKLWNRNFTLLVLGQLISIFGNQVLTFALPLYILQTHGSPALFGTVLGLSFLPLVITAPIGGIMADRLKKQRIMFWLDVITTTIIVLFTIMNGLFSSAIVFLVIIKLLALNTIQGMYMPAVQASVPLIVAEDNLVRANSATTFVNYFSSMIAPAIAAFLLGRFDLFPILVVCAICFAITSIIDLALRIPFQKQETSKTVIQIAKSDISQALHFCTIGQPILIKIAAILFVTTLLVGGIIFVGIPIFITSHLGMGIGHVGIGRALSWIGPLLGTAIAGFLGERLTIKKFTLFTVLSGFAFIPIGISLILDMPNYMAFAIITSADAICGLFGTLYTISMFSYIQRVTPQELIGKVMSFFTALPFVSLGIGAFVFGLLFGQFYSVSWVIILVAAVLSSIPVMLLYRSFKNV